MKFIADEGVDGSLVALLREAKFDVLYFAEYGQSTEDSVILNLAKEEDRILITRDKDFGELVYRMKMLHTGIILVRLETLTSRKRSELVTDFIKNNLNLLHGYFMVIQPGSVRLRKI